MLTPVDVQNKIFKGGIGFDKKDVEMFMKEVSADYEQLYRSNVELKDKVATLTESLQHYRSTEDSMQKALTLSEKTAEETIIAANDKARQINNEATKKAEAILADAKQELTETKNEIHRLKQLYAKFKSQYTYILQGQLQLIENKVVDIDLGEGYEMEAFNKSEFGHGEGGLSSLGEGGGYTGASSFDDRFERTNQEPAFNRGSLNTDPFEDAANGGGRFSRQTGKGFINNSSSKKNSNSTGEGKSGLNVKKTNTSSTKVKRNFTAAAQKHSPEQNSTAHTAESATSANHQAAAKTVTNSQSDVKSAEQTTTKSEAMKSVKTSVSATETKRTSPISESVKTSSHKDDFRKESAVSGDIDEKTKKSTLIGNDDDNNEGFDFIGNDSSKTTYREGDGIVSGEVEKKMDENTLLGNDDDDNEGFNFMEESNDINSFDSERFASKESVFVSDDVITGEVEDHLNESTMLDSEDNYDEGFDFVSDTDTDSVQESSNSFSEDEDVAYAGEVEDRLNESTMLDSEDNYDQGLDFVVGNESEEDDIPTISSGATLNINLDSFQHKSEEDDIFVGDVEDPANQSNLIGNADDDSEGFSFL